MGSKAVIRFILTWYCTRNLPDSRIWKGHYTSLLEISPRCDLYNYISQVVEFLQSWTSCFTAHLNLIITLQYNTGLIMPRSYHDLQPLYTEYVRGTDRLAVKPLMVFPYWVNFFFFHLAHTCGFLTKLVKTPQSLYNVVEVTSSNENMWEEARSFASACCLLCKWSWQYLEQLYYTQIRY